jgi:hypothetical protein
VLAARCELRLCEHIHGSSANRWGHRKHCILHAPCCRQLLLMTTRECAL